MSEKKPDFAGLDPNKRLPVGTDRQESAHDNARFKPTAPESVDVSKIDDGLGKAYEASDKSRMNVSGEEARKMQAELSRKMIERKMAEIRAQIQESTRDRRKSSEEVAVDQHIAAIPPKKKSFFARIFGKK